MRAATVAMRRTALRISSLLRTGFGDGSKLGLAVPGRNRGIPLTLVAAVQPACELRARVDAELGVDARQVAFHGLRRDDERGRDLLRGEARGDEVGDAALGRGQTARRRRTAAEARELRLRLGGPERRAQLLEDRERGVERLARGVAALRTPPRRAEREQRAPALERRRQPLVLDEG